VADQPPFEACTVRPSRGTWAPIVAPANSWIVTVGSLGNDPRFAAFSPALGHGGIADHAAILVPLAVHDQTVGLVMLTFANGLPAHVESERAALAFFGDQIGSAVLNAAEYERECQSRQRAEQLLEEERENSRQVRALHEVSRTFAASLSLDDTMRAVVEAMAHRLDVDAVWIRTPNERGNHMVLQAFYAAQPELSTALERMISAPEMRDDPLVVHLMQHRQPVLISGGDPLTHIFPGSTPRERLPGRDPPGARRREEQRRRQAGHVDLVGLGPGEAQGVTADHGLEERDVGGEGERR